MSLIYLAHAGEEHTTSEPLTTEDKTYNQSNNDVAAVAVTLVAIVLIVLVVKLLTRTSETVRK